MADESTNRGLSIEWKFVLGFSLIGLVLSIVLIANRPTHPFEITAESTAIPSEAANPPLILPGPKQPANVQYPAPIPRRNDTVIPMTGIEDEGKRKVIFWEIYVALRTAEAKARELGVSRDDSDRIIEIDRKYVKELVEDRYGITKYQQMLIHAEGAEKSWPHPPLSY